MTITYYYEIVRNDLTNKRVLYNHEAVGEYVNNALATGAEEIIIRKKPAK